MPRRYSDPHHPLWKFLRFLVVGVVLTIVLAVNAENFDETEARAITAFLAAYGSYEVGEHLYQKKEKNDE